MPFNWADYLLPVLLLLLLGVSVLKKVPVFDGFVKGAAQALHLVKGIFPYLAAVFVCIVLFEQSGMQAALLEFLSPVFDILGVPPDLAQLILLKPLSGSGSTAALESILSQHDPDGYVGRCASVIAGSCETTLYVAAVYFGTVREKRLRYGIPVALLCTIFASIAACWLCRVM